MVPKEWCSMNKRAKPFDILLKNSDIRGLKKEEQRECGFNFGMSNEFK